MLARRGPAKGRGARVVLGACALAVLLVAASGGEGRAGEEDGTRPPRQLDCRYAALDASRAAAGAEPAPTSVSLPRDDVFRPLLADPRQPRFFADYTRTRFRGEGLPAGGPGREIDVGSVGLGGTFGLWSRRYRPGCDGLQVSIFGAILSQFNLDAPSSDLINTDFLVGPTLTLRRGRWSARARLYHQSSHLGDEFLLRTPGVVRHDLAFEVLDLLGSVEGQWWRLYGGGGAIVHDSEDPPLDTWLVQGGVELQGPGHPLGTTRLRPVAGVDLASTEDWEWGLRTSARAGFEWARADGAQHIRVLVHYYYGFSPFGQFFLEKVEGFGVSLQFDF